MDEEQNRWWGPIDGPRPVHFAASSKKQEQAPATRLLADEDHDADGLWHLPTARASFIGACENRVVVPGSRRTVVVSHDNLDGPRRRLYDVLRALQERDRELTGLKSLGGSGQGSHPHDQHRQTDLAAWAPKGARLEADGADPSSQQKYSTALPVIAAVVLKEELPRAVAEKRALESEALDRASDLQRLEDEVRGTERVMTKLEDQLTRQALGSSSCSTSLVSTEVFKDGDDSINCWKESAILLEGEIRRKASRALELHHRVHRLEAELRRQLQANEDNVTCVATALQNTWQALQAIPSRH